MPSSRTVIESRAQVDKPPQILFNAVVQRHHPVYLDQGVGKQPFQLADPILFLLGERQGPEPRQFFHKVIGIVHQQRFMFGRRGEQVVPQPGPYLGNIGLELRRLRLFV